MNRPLVKEKWKCMQLLGIIQVNISNIKNANLNYKTPNFTHKIGNYKKFDQTLSAGRDYSLQYVSIRWETKRILIRRLPNITMEHYVANRTMS